MKKKKNQNFIIFFNNKYYFFYILYFNIKIITSNTPSLPHLGILCFHK